MSAPYDPLGAAAYALVALVWLIAADDAWRVRLKSRLRSPVSLLLPLAATSMACFYGIYACAALLMPPHSAERAPRWFELTDIALLAGIAFLRHLTRALDLDAAQPSRRWLLAVYGSAVLLAAVSVFPELIPAPTLAAQVTLSRLPLPFFVVGMLALSLRDVRRLVRPGRWLGSAAVARGADVLVVTLTVAGAGVLFAVLTASAREAWTAGYLM